MHELPLTKDVIAALEDAGVDPTSAEPEAVLVIAAYLDLLAKEYGLTESQDLDTDPLERTQQPGPVMDVVRHYLASGAAELDAKSVRDRLYNIFVELAGDASARKTLNRNNPLTEGKFLHLAQIYWNLEANDVRPKLPIKPANGRDIPVSGVPRDFATMLWTARCNEKGPSYKSSGAGFRKQGARLAVLAATKLMENAEPMQDTARTALAVQTTSNPAAPLEVALKELVERAQAEGQHDVAVQTATSYLSIIQQRAEATPFESEPDLADAYLLRGWAQMHLQLDRFDRGTRAEFSGRDDIEAAILSLSTLVGLEPDNVDHRANLVVAFVALSMVHHDADDPADAVATAHQALAIAEGIPAERPERPKAELWAYIALTTVSDGTDAINAAERAEAALARYEEAMDPNERSREQESIAAVRARIQTDRLGEAAAIESLWEAVVTAERLVAAGDDAQRVLVGPLVELAQALLNAGRHSEAAPTAARALALVTPEYVQAHPRFDVSLPIWIVWSETGGSDRVTEAHAALLDAASEAAPGNMRTLVTSIFAFDKLAKQRRDAGLDADAHAWVLRAVAAARRLRPTEIHDDFRRLIVVTLESLFLKLVLAARVSESDNESVEPKETIVRLLNDIDPGSGDFMSGLE